MNRTPKVFGGMETRYSFRLYLTIVFCIPAVLFAAAFAAANTRWFFYHDNYFMLRNIGYGLTLHHADCQVVITGDSSALTGLDPLVISRVTGLSACNVAEGSTVTTVAGWYPLDAYLKQNAPPKYIIFMFTPSLFRPSRSWRDFGSYFEGIVYLLQFERNKDTYLQLLKHPYEALNFSVWATQSILSDTLVRLTNPHKYAGIEDPESQRRRQNGLFTFYSDPETRCFRNGWDKSIKIESDPKWVSGLRERYGVAGTHVIVNVAPVPDCDDMTDVYQNALAGVHDNPLEVLPIKMFNSQDVHFAPSGAEHVSLGAANQILANEARMRP